MNAKRKPKADDVKVDPTRAQIGDLEIFRLTDAIDGRAHPKACDDEPPEPGYYFYVGEPTDADSELQGPFESVLAAQEW